MFPTRDQRGTKRFVIIINLSFFHCLQLSQPFLTQQCLKGKCELGATVYWNYAIIHGNTVYTAKTEFVCNSSELESHYCYDHLYSSTQPELSQASLCSFFYQLSHSASVMLSSGLCVMVCLSIQVCFYCIDNAFEIVIMLKSKAITNQSLLYGILW